MLSAPWLLTGWALVLVACDLRWRRLPNLLLLCAALPALVLLLVQGAGPLGAGWAESLAGAVLGLAVWWPGYGLRKLGAGDVKLAGTIGLLLGLAAMVEATLVAALILGLMAVAARLTGGKRARLPAAVALSGGMLLRMFWGPLWIG